MAKDEVHPDVHALMQKIARYPEGRIALAKMIQDELRDIDWHICGAIARCEVARAKEVGDGSG